MPLLLSIIRIEVHPSQLAAPGTGISKAETNVRKACSAHFADRLTTISHSKNPRTAGFSAESPDQTEKPVWVVADAVGVEPVSARNSLRTGKRTGNFQIFGRFGSKLSLLSQQSQAFSSSIPYSLEQGIPFSITGNLDQQTGTP
jgi:hypothetical protein